MNTWRVLFESWVSAAVLLAAAVFAGMALYRILLQALSRLNRGRPGAFSAALMKHGRAPLRSILPLLLLSILMQAPVIPAGIGSIVDKIITVLLILNTAWLLAQMLSVVEDVVLKRFDIAERDNLRARRIHTQFRLIKQIVTVVIVIVALAMVLMSFGKFRQLGTGILASAGVAGIIMGLAARPILENLLSGMQILFTEPIRLDDIVIVEKEWGRVEEIALTYVVVQLWDMRRMVVPVRYFLERPFQNWTRTSADMIGTVFLYLDYRVPVEEVRQELHRLLKASPLWNGGVWSLQVTDATERTVQLRAIMDARDSSSAWDLRCEIREKLLEFIQQNYPAYLPRLRVEMEPAEQAMGGMRTPDAQAAR